MRRSGDLRRVMTIMLYSLIVLGMVGIFLLGVTADVERPAPTNPPTQEIRIFIEDRPIVEYTPIPYPESYTSLENPIDENPRYGFTEDEVYLLAQLLCGDGMIDGDGEYDFDWELEPNYYEVGKVLCVVMNRVRSDQFPNTVTDVVKQDGQFEVMPRNLSRTPSDISLGIIQTWCDSYDRYDGHVQVIPESHLYFRGDGLINTTRENW